jgi:hypothetical protein
VWRTARHVSTLQTAKLCVFARILDAYLDAPRPDSGGDSDHGSSLSARLKWFDVFVRYYAARGVGVDQVLDMGVACCFQVLRAHYISIGEGDKRCIPPSAALKTLAD